METLETTKNGLATMEQAESHKPANKNSFEIQTIDLNGQMPDLSQAIETPIDLMSDYWTPVNPGESKRVVFVKIDSRPVADQTSGEIFDLECAFFLEQTPTKEVRMVSNGSKRLVGAISASNLAPGTPLLITYMGKKKNKNNGYSSDNWSVKPLIVNL
jgi:hypothetical protein